MDFYQDYDPFVDDLLDYVQRCIRNATDATGHMLVTGIIWNKVDKLSLP